MFSYLPIFIRFLSRHILFHISDDDKNKMEWRNSLSLTEFDCIGKQYPINFIVLIIIDLLALI